MNSCVFLAKKAVETFIKERKVVSLPNGLPEELLKRKAGTFVTVEDASGLRGCIGTYLPTKKNIVEEVVYNAIAAATEDYRFYPIQPEELAGLFYTVYILSEPEIVKEIKTPADFYEEKFRKAGLDPEKYGVIVKTLPIGPAGKTDVVFNGHCVPKTGLLLPGLKGVKIVEEQIAIACQKGGINPLKEKVFIYRFTAKKHTEI